MRGRTSVFYVLSLTRDQNILSSRAPVERFVTKAKRAQWSHHQGRRKAKGAWSDAYDRHSAKVFDTVTAAVKAAKGFLKSAHVEDHGVKFVLVYEVTRIDGPTLAHQRDTLKFVAQVFASGIPIIDKVALIHTDDLEGDEGDEAPD